jgi:hypothetical protein
MTVKLPLRWVLAGSVMLLAFMSRLLLLGNLPLQPDEAEQALAALGATVASPFWSGGAAVPPAYGTLTAAIMGGFGASEFAARLMPALAGILLILLPLVLAHRIGWTRALATSFCLLISGVSVVVSRSAGSEALAALGLTVPLAVAWSSPHDTRGPTIVAGIALGIGLSSGPGWWMGALAWGTGAVVVEVVRKRRMSLPGFSLSILSRLRDWLWPAVVVALLLSTRFGTELGAAGSSVSGLGQWLAGWAGPGTHPMRMLLLLPIYEPLLLVGGVLGAFQLWRSGEGMDQASAAIALVSLGWVLLYPNRQPNDLIWVVLPLAFLCGGWIERMLDAISDLGSNYAVLILSGVLLTLGSFSHFQFQASMAGFGLASLDKVSQLYFALASLGFAAALILLFGFGWSWLETYLALQSALLISTAALTIAATRHLGSTSIPGRGVELWRARSTSPNAFLLEDTLKELARTEVGRDGGLAVDLRGGPEPILSWSLRNHTPARTDPEGEPPAIIIVPEAQADTPLAAEYLGQAFALIEQPGWSGVAPPDFLAWWLDRKAPTVSQRWIVFVRSDVVALEEAQGSEDG